MNTQKLKDILKDPKTNWKYIAVVAILAFIAGAVIMNYLSKTWFEIPQITLPKRIDETANWKTYRNEEYGFEIKYPGKLKLIEKQNEVILNHSIPYENSGDCDMAGGNTIYKKLDDFNISFELIPGIVSLRYSDGEYKAGILEGKMVIIGAEGCGYVEYNFPIENSKTLVVKRAQIQALSGISSAWNREEILKSPGVISPEESTRIFDQILSTFTLY